MRVVHLSCVGPPEIGGIGRVASQEVSLLRARGIDARLVVPEAREGSETKDERSFITRLPGFRVGNAAWLSGVGAALTGADVIHLHYPWYMMAERLLWRKPDVPVVVTFHMDAVVGGWRAPVAVLHRLLIQPFLLRNASRILVSSFDYARRSSLAGFFQRNPSRVIETPFGVDLDVFTPGPAVRERFHVPSGVPVILFVGGMDRAHAFKGVPELLRAFRGVPEDAHLLLVGDGDQRPTFESLARELGIERRTHFVGRIDAEALRDAYRSADVFAFPSTSGAEAFGLAALEAEACGLPVVASDLPGVRTVVVHGETGLLVPPQDVAALTEALRTLVSDRAMRERLSARAAEHAKRFSWDAHTDTLLQTYKDVCASRS